jgi:hypothetical protein
MAAYCSTRIAEDEHGRPTIPQPIPLAGAADRIGQIVATSISEVPYIDVREYPCPDEPSKGYLLVIVPQSGSRAASGHGRRRSPLLRGAEPRATGA